MGRPPAILVKLRLNYPSAARRRCYPSWSHPNETAPFAPVRHPSPFRVPGPELRACRHGHLWLCDL
ncbi:hypothetical protein XFF6991_4892 [Xanthomonas phaseoli pv. phaseoli]|uniref:Uncharacterized protein n=1 Tax=Xanthomonas campestris pv. phaseoli TaxID=317013 RepID=A0A7Z7J3V4_XANCH|nr:hypothetical protein XFF6991_4892 [Xanthomonas phaseoli pv. phaseoli]